MTNYKDLGFVNTKEMMNKALKGGYAVPAYNFNNMEQLQAIINACTKTQSPLILQVSKGAREYANETLLQYMGQGAVQMMKEIARKENLKEIPIALHLDHGTDFEICKSCIEKGFSSVMIDGSSLPYEENVELTKKVVEHAHKYDVTVEGELGVLAGVEDEIKSEEHQYTQVEEVVDFVTRTGVDSLAIAIGTSHGAYKFKLGQDPKIRLDILENIEKELPDFQIVLHGSSSVPQEYIEMINSNGGGLEQAIGIPEDQLREASKRAVCKINIDTDGRLVMTGIIRKIFSEDKKVFDPRKYLGPARDALEKMYTRKNIEVLGSANKV